MTSADPDAILHTASPGECLAALEEVLSGAASRTRLIALYNAALRCASLGALDEAAALVDRLTAEETDFVPTDPGAPTVREAALQLLGDVRVAQQSAEEAFAPRVQAARIALDNDRPWLCLRTVCTALSGRSQGGPDSVGPALDFAERAVDQIGPGEPLLRALDQLGYEAHRLGAGDRAVWFLERALPLARFGDDETTATILNNLVVICHEIGDMARVARYGRRAAAAVEKVGRPGSATLLAHTVEAETDLGRAAEALALLDEIEPEMLAPVPTVRAALLIMLKRHAEAIQVLNASAAGPVGAGTHRHVAPAAPSLAAQLESRIARETSRPAGPRLRSLRRRVSAGRPSQRRRARPRDAAPCVRRGTVPGSRLR